MAEKRPDRTLGRHHDTFWEWCAKGELRVQKCTACGHLAFPVVQKCEACGEPEMTWEKLSGRGKVISWNRFVQDYYHGMMSLPYDCILVALEEGPTFMGNPNGFGCDDLTPFMDVKVAFIECEDSAGVFSLPVFEQA
ncbi:MAG: Zn-ribbon domain-containing OB-fold protein [Novosphingobium sp.]